MTIKTSNTHWVENLTNKNLASNAKTYLEQGYDIPCIFYDLIDEMIDRLGGKYD